MAYTNTTFNGVRIQYDVGADKYSNYNTSKWAKALIQDVDPVYDIYGFQAVLYSTDSNKNVIQSTYKADYGIVKAYVETNYLPDFKDAHAIASAKSKPIGSYVIVKEHHAWTK